MRVITGVALTGALLVGTACGPAAGGRAPDAKGLGGDAPPGSIDAPPGPIVDGAQAGYAIYAHADHVLYSVDLQQKTLKTVGPFNAPQVMVGTKMVEDVITDLAVAPDNTIYVVSETAIYTASATDGHVTKIGSLAACGSKTVALTTTPSGKIYAGDFSGKLCEIDVATSPPTVKPPVTMAGGYALTGDMVAVDDGTIYGTAYKLADPANMGTQKNNLLVTIDVATGAVTPIGTGSGYPKLFGASYGLGKVFGFTHDGTGNVVTIDRTTGAGTVYATFLDPTTQKGISFAGAGVNSLVVVN